MARGERISEEDLGLVQTAEAVIPELDEMTLEEAEQVMIRKALERCDGNVTDAAEALGLSRSALYRRLEKHDLRPAE